MTHEGWANRETWAVRLHIVNDEAWKAGVLAALREASIPEPIPDGEMYGPNGETPNERQAARERAAGEIIRENVEDRLSIEWLACLSPHRDALRDWALVRDDIGSLWRVNWDELGAAFLRDLDEE